MRTFGYIRVSSIEQESGHGPEVQAAAVAAYCTAKGLGAPELIHESASAESIAGRKEFLRLLATARELALAGEQVHLVFRSSDRLARELMDQESVVATSFQVGFRLHSTLPHEADLFDPAFARDPMRTAIRQFFGIFNQLDKAIIKSRLDGGLYMKASKGGSTGGRYPFGYMGVNGEIVPCPEEVPAVRRVFQLAAEDLDLASIATVVAREYPLPCGSWSKTHVKRVLDRADVYVHGLYRSRLAAAAVLREDLILVRSGEPPPEPAALGPICWERIPDPVAAHTLGLLIGRQATWVKEKAVALSVVVRWKGSRMLLPHASAKTIAEAAAAGS